MIISQIFRTLASLLSFWSFNEEISEKKDLYIRKIIQKQISKIKIENKNLNKTHQKFNLEISNLLKSRNLKNFLRKNFIQKMFFVHNRFFILKELNILRKDKKWKFYQRIIEEDNVGDPVRYFLYPKSSGNKINHAYHLSVLSSELNLDLRKVHKVFEFGGGYGCMARIFSKINNKISYICFDTNYINLLQYYYLSHEQIQQKK